MTGAFTLQSKTLATTVAVASRHQYLANITMTQAVVDGFFATEAFLAKARALHALLTFAANIVFAIRTDRPTSVATIAGFGITVYIWITKLI
jgi:hypothetical protein